MGAAYSYMEMIGPSSTGFDLGLDCCYTSTGFVDYARLFFGAFIVPKISPTVSFTPPIVMSPPPLII